MKNKLFGKLKVLEEKGRSKDRAIIWLCLCDCGNLTSVKSTELRNGHVKSCGCLRSPPILKRFLEKIEIQKETNCWNWTGNTVKGYGQFWANSHTVLAHRFSYKLYKGDIPNNILVCHTCDNRSCVNPDHLFLGTHQDNADDMKSKNRQTRNYGMKNGAYKSGKYCKNKDMTENYEK